MKNNKPMNYNDDRYRVITFDNDRVGYRSPSLIEYLASVKKWFKGSSDQSMPRKDVATTVTLSKGVQKSRSGSAIALKSISSNILRRYTRSKTLSLVDLKRMFVKNNSSIEKGRSSKKRSSRTKVKNEEHFMNYDRDLEVLYSCDTHRFSQKVISTDASKITTTSLESSIDRGRGKKLVTTWNCGRKVCKPPDPNRVKFRCDYPNKYCNNKRTCPYYLEISPREKKSSQHRNAKVFGDRTCSVFSACILCCPGGGKLASKPDHYTQTPKKCTPYCSPTQQAAYPRTNHIDPQSSKLMVSSWCSKRLEAAPKSDYPNVQTYNNNNLFTPKIDAGQTTDYTNAHSSNKIRVCCCSKLKERRPKTDHDYAYKIDAGLTTDYANVESSNKMRKCCCSKQKEGSPKIDHDNTYKSNRRSAACCAHKGKQTDIKSCHFTTHKSTSFETLNRQHKLQQADLNTYAITQTCNNICTCYCDPPRQETDHKSDFASTQTSNTNRLLDGPFRKDIVDNQTSCSNMFTCCFPKWNQRGPKIESMGIQTSNNRLYTCCCLQQTDDRPRCDNAKMKCTKKKNKLRCYCICTKKSRYPKNKKSQTYFSRLQRRNLSVQTPNCRRHTKRPCKCCADVEIGSTVPQPSAWVRIVRTPVKRRCRCFQIQTLPEHHVCSCQASPESQVLRDTALCTSPNIDRRQLLLQGTSKVQENIVAQTSELMLLRECTCLQKIIDNQAIVPDQKKPYILYHNSARGWLVKPLRKRVCHDATNPDRIEEDELPKIDLTAVSNNKSKCYCTRNIQERTCCKEEKDETRPLFEKGQRTLLRNELDINSRRNYEEPYNNIKRNFQAYFCSSKRERKGKMCSLCERGCSRQGTSCSHSETNCFRLEKACSNHSAMCSRRGPECLRREPECSRRGPECLRREPECSRRGPECLRREPECSRRGPECSRREPEFSCRGPECSQRGPECLRREPECSRKGPECLRREPEYSRREPECSRKEPECSRRGPKCLRRDPECLCREPKCSRREPQCSSKEPECSCRRSKCSRRGPECLRKEPECSCRGPDCSSGEPEYSCRRSKCSSREPKCSRKKRTCSRKEPTCSRRGPKCSRKGPDCSYRGPECPRKEPACTRRDKACSPRKNLGKYDCNCCQNGWCHAGIYECSCCRDKRCNLRSAMHRARIKIRKCFYNPAPCNYADDCEWLCLSTPVYCCENCCRGCGKCCKCFMLCITAVFWVPVMMLVYFLRDVLFNTCF